MSQRPKVFISYRHESPSHSKRVLSLAARLVTEGIDAMIDQWIVDPPGGWAFWTEQQLAKADFVLLICTTAYRSYVEDPGLAQGAGVFWEVNLIRSYLYTSKASDTRFIPLYYGAGVDTIPMILRTATSYQIDTSDGYLDLYSRLTGQPADIRPALGAIRILTRATPETELGVRDTGLADYEASLPEISTFVRLTPLEVKDEGSLRSQDYALTTFIRFDNYLADPVVIYWINYEGQRVFYSEVEAGRSQLQETYVGHLWVVAKRDVSDKGKSVALFEAAKEPGIAAIELPVR